MNFDLLRYTHDTLRACLHDEPEFIGNEFIPSRRHTEYLQQYLDELNADTILVEKDYVDRDYLQDYAQCYDRCFFDYPRRTNRVHFFSCDLTIEDFEYSLITPDSPVVNQLKESYLGFVVVKLLPQAIIGRTCLKTYSADHGRRNFPCLRQYPVSLYGINLEVLSIAYQEQDRVVAACATSALWSCFQGTGKLFQHYIPAPVEITKWATDLMPDNVVSDGARAFPNNGLTAKQMAHAISQVELESHIFRGNSRYNLNAGVYAYLRGKIPSLLSVQSARPTEYDVKFVGAHAVSILGYSLDEQSEYEYVHDRFRLRATKIDKLYVHDDLVGPFCRLGWVNLPSPQQMPGDAEEQSVALKTSLNDSVYYIPDFVLLPLYHKIKIPFSLIHDNMVVLNSLLDAWAGGSEPPEWDIFLTTVNEYKSSIRSEYAELGVDFRDCLYAQLPRFLWRVSVRREGILQMDFLFDATGMDPHRLLVHVFSTECDDKDYFMEMAAPEYQAVLRNVPQQVKSIIRAFATTRSSESDPS
ncbi:hypothetical protein [Pseudomonas urmiensis]|uniref:hypothetical protein n=1 Tax=Pseudomonas urmiensis TaxID=2745493 RepID=UPI003C8FF096